MKEIAERLYKIVDDHSEKLRSISEVDLAAKTDPNKWSKKEIVGHMIDSAQSNIRRFVVAQYEDAPFIMYNQDKWVSISNYQNYPTKDLIQLWTLLNKHICIILSNTNKELAQRVCKTNNQTEHTIEWLAQDYIKHLLHHLHQVLDLEPVVYP
jgi:DinB family protein